MPIKHVHTTLSAPKTEKVAGWPPDRQGRFGPLLGEAWAAKRPPLPRATAEARFRHSDAAGCARAIAYAALDLPETNPMDVAGIVVAEMGSLMHEAFQDKLEDKYGLAATVEVKVGSGDRAGHIDAVVRLAHFPGCDQDHHPDAVCDPETGRDGPYVIVIEAKSLGGYAYQLAVGARGAPEGPKHSAVVQAALNGYAVDADEVVIVCWGRDAISIQAGARKDFSPERRYTAEWTLTRQQYEPIALREIERITAILALVDEGTLPARKIPQPRPGDYPGAKAEMPPGHLIVDPAKGSWVQYDRDDSAVDAGATWQCAYCRYQDLCIQTPAGRTPLAELVTEE